jgi:hypothetical protein
MQFDPVDVVANKLMASTRTVNFDISPSSQGLSMLSRDKDGRPFWPWVFCREFGILLRGENVRSRHTLVAAMMMMSLASLSD